MTQHDWNAHYASANLPWETGRAESVLIDWIQAGAVAPGPALEIGCGTGSNALWLAEKGFDVLGVDIAPLAIERARARAKPGSRCRFQVHDFVHDEPLTGSFGLVFDRGCFHVFDSDEERARFAQRVSTLLAPGGMWLSLMGSTEGGPRDAGPPRRSARDIAHALEPHVELVCLRAIVFDELPGIAAAKAWFCLSRRRDLPAQPSTR
jgi:SAM-dependent methyltransferase